MAFVQTSEAGPRYRRGIQKTYALLKPFNINKTAEQMAQESMAAQTRFMDRIQNIPRRADLMNHMSRVKDQGLRGTCVAFASVALVEGLVKAAYKHDVDFSEQYIYWFSKAVMKSLPNNEGSEPIDMLRAIAIHGLPLELVWNYEPLPWFGDAANHPDCFQAYKINPENLPTHCVTNGHPPATSDGATKLLVIQPQKIGTAPEAIVAFLSSGIPVEVGIDFYDRAWSFDNSGMRLFLSGIVRMPLSTDVKSGGHAVLLVGYDLDKEIYLFKNSWGVDEWGSQNKYPGYGTIPFDYVRRFGEAVVARLPYQ